MSEISDPNKLKVTELRAELQARGLDSKGNKPVLVERLREALEAEKNEACEDTEEVEEQAEKEEKEQEMQEDGVGEETEEPEQAVGEEPQEEEEVEAPVEAVEEAPAKEEAAPEKEEEEDIVQEQEEEANAEEKEEQDETPAVEEEAADAAAPTEEEPEKKDYEDAPMEEIDADDKMEQEDESEDKSAVDLIKEDFFNGHTEELQGLDEEDENKEEVPTPSATPTEEAEVKQEPASELPTEEQVKKEVVEEEATAPAAAAEAAAGAAVKQEEGAETDGTGDETWDHKRGKKRAGSPITMDDEGSSKKSRSDAADVYIIKNVNEFDKTLVVLDYGNADLSLRIEKDSRLEGTPMTDKCFGYMWHGVRSTYGFTSGRICFEVRLDKNLPVQLEESEVHPHVVRVGWSAEECSLTLGEEANSWGYGGTGKASTNLKFKDYGIQFGEGDVVGAYLDLDVEPAVMSFTVNGDHQGIAYEISKTELAEGQALFPHILTKNVKFSVNFGSVEPFNAANPIEGFTFAGKVPLEERVAATPVPDNRGDCEVIMMVGLPACGKTTWIEKFVSENKSMKYTVLGTNDLIDKMKVNGIRRKRNYAGRWDQLIMACTKGLNHLLHLACNRRRNYIIDQTNVYPSAQKRKMRGFTGFKRRAVVICPSDEDLKLRTQKREKEEGKDVPDSAVLEMKANFKLPVVGEHFDSVEFVELDAEEAQKLVEQYNKEGQAATALPKSFGNNRGGGGQGINNNRRDYGGGDRGGRDYRNNNNGGGGFRGGWDRDRDRRGGYDRRDRGGGWNRPGGRDFSSRLGPGSGPNSGGYNRDNRSTGGYNNRDNRGSGGYNNRVGGGGYRDNRGVGGRGYQSGGYNKYPETSNYSSSNTGWNQQGSYGQGYGQGYGVQSSGYGSQGYGAAGSVAAPAASTTPAYGQGQTGAYNWNQQYYNQQQPAQQYYGQSQTGYRSDSTAATGSSWGASSSSTAASAWGTQQQSAWGAQSTTAAAPAAAAVPSAQQQIWGTSGYQPAASSTQWGTQPQSSSSYGGYSYGYKK